MFIEVFYIIKFLSAHPEMGKVIATLKNIILNKMVVIILLILLLLTITTSIMFQLLMGAKIMRNIEEPDCSELKKVEHQIPNEWDSFWVALISGIKFMFFMD